MYMRDVNRIEPTLARIGEIWKKYPDLRLGQLILNLGREEVLYYLEDKDLVEALENFYLNSCLNRGKA